MKEEDIRKVYEEVRREYHYPPTDIAITDEQTFYIQNGVVHVDGSMMTDVEYARSILRHEIGHIHFAPITIAQHKKNMVMVSKVLGIEPEYSPSYPSSDTIKLIHMTCNLFYDFVVDMATRKLLNDDTEHRTRVDIENDKKLGTNYDEKMKNPLMQIYGGYYNRLMGKDLFEGLKAECVAAGCEIHDIIKSRLPVQYKLNDFCEIIKKFLSRKSDGGGNGGDGGGDGKDEGKGKSKGGNGKGKASKSKDGEASKSKDEPDFDEDGTMSNKGVEKVKQFLDDVKKTFDKNLEGLSTMETASDDPSDVDRALQEIVGDYNGEKDEDGNPSDKRGDMKKDIFIMCGISDAVHRKMNAFEYYKMLAKRKVQFNVKVMRPAVGKIERGSVEGWTIDDEPEDLEVDESLFVSPIIIPEVSTVKFEKKKGYEMGLGIPKVMMIIDTSGSMDIGNAIISCFSFIETCRYYGTEFSIILFSNNPYYYTKKFTKDYDKYEHEVHGSYISGGTIIHSACEKAVELLEKERDCLVILVSDFEAVDNDLGLTIDSLRGLSRRHIVNTIDFASVNEDGSYSHGWMKDAVIELRSFSKHHHIDSLNDLSRVIISTVSDSIIK